LPANELVKSIYTELELDFVSHRLSKGFITEAIHIALRGRQRQLQDKRSSKERENVNMKKAIGFFTQELMIIDSVSPKIDIFATGVLAGALIMLGMNLPILKFLTQLNDHRGEVRGGLNDPVELLLKAIHRHRISKRTAQPRMAIDLCKKTIQAITIWLEGEQSAKYWRIKDLSGLEIMPVIQEMKRQKKITGERDL
jgi:transposase